MDSQRHNHNPIPLWPLLPVLCLLAFISSPECAQAQRRSRPSKSPDHVQWYAGQYPEAKKEALERNAPTVICCILEGEEASDRFRSSLMESKNLAESSQSALWLVANNGDHPVKEIKVPGPDGKDIVKQVCSAFGTRDCKTHKHMWDAVYKKFVMPNGGEWSLPEAIVLTPEWKLEKRLGEGDPPALSTITKAVAKIVKHAGGCVRADDLAGVRKQAIRLETMTKARLWDEVWHASAEILRLAPAGPHHAAAKAGQNSAGQAMKTDLQELAEGFSAESAERTYRRLMDYEFDGSPVTAELKVILSQARRDPILKKIMARVDLEIAAEGLLESLQQALRDDDRSLAKRTLRKLLSKKYAETSTAAEARERYKDLEPEQP